MDKHKMAKFLSFSYIVLAIIIIVFASRLFMLSKEVNQEAVKVENLLSDAISTERYITSDQLSGKIINHDPSFLLVDVREAKYFEKYSLPNAINIPISKLFDKEFEGYLNQEQYDIIFFSNDNLFADQAWLLCRKSGLNNLSVLKGGLNEWFETIINPAIPSEDMPETDFNLYSERKAASMYFGVAYPKKNIIPEKKIVKKNPPKVVTVKKKKKKMPVEGGC